MADRITVKDTAPSYTPAPEGQHQAVAVDVIDLGERVESFAGQDPKLVHKVAIVYQIDEVNPETGKRFDIAVEKTLSFGAKSGLRKWVEAWRGKAYTDQEAREKGVPLDQMVGVNGFIVIEHKTSAKGNVYALASNIMPKPKAVPAISPLNYERPEFWAKRKQEYAATAAAFGKTNGNGAHSGSSDEGYPPPHDDESDLADLPF